MYIKILTTHKPITNSHQIPITYLFFCTSYIHNNVTNISRKRACYFHNNVTTCGKTDVMYIKILTTHKPKISTTYLASCYIHNNVTTYLASCYIHNKYQSHTFFSVPVIYITMSRSYQRNRCYVHINFDHKFTPNTNHIPFFLY
jgi:hypothetical protein